jgi:hypothetical protein
MWIARERRIRAAQLRYGPLFDQVCRVLAEADPKIGPWSEAWADDYFYAGRAFRVMRGLADCGSEDEVMGLVRGVFARSPTAIDPEREPEFAGVYRFAAAAIWILVSKHREGSRPEEAWAALERAREEARARREAANEAEMPDQVRRSLMGAR